MEQKILNFKTVFVSKIPLLKSVKQITGFVYIRKAYDKYFWPTENIFKTCFTEIPHEFSKYMTTFCSKGGPKVTLENVHLFRSVAYKKKATVNKQTSTKIQINYSRMFWHKEWSCTVQHSPCGINETRKSYKGSRKSTI